MHLEEDFAPHPVPMQPSLDSKHTDIRVFWHMGTLSGEAS